LLEPPLDEYIRRHADEISPMSRADFLTPAPICAHLRRRRALCRRQLFADFLAAAAFRRYRMPRRFLELFARADIYADEDAARPVRHDCAAPSARGCCCASGRHSADASLRPPPRRMILPRRRHFSDAMPDSPQ